MNGNLFGDFLEGGNSNDCENLPQAQKCFSKANFLDTSLDDGHNLESNWSFKNLPLHIASKDALTQEWNDLSFVWLTNFDGPTLNRENRNNNFEGKTTTFLDCIYVYNDQNLIMK